MDEAVQQPQKIEKKKRKTFDEYVGINGLGIIGIVGMMVGGVLKPIGAVAGISAIYYLVKKRKKLDSKQKWIGWILVILWLLVSGSFSNVK